MAVNDAWWQKYSAEHAWRAIWVWLTNNGTTNPAATGPGVDTEASAGGATEAEQQTQTTHLAQIEAATEAIQTAVQILDDWDQSDRAKVNSSLVAKRLVDVDGTLLEVKYAKQVVSADTADFIAPSAGKKILVVSGLVQKQADNTNVVTMKFNNSVANTIIAGAPEITMKNCADGAVLPFSPGGWFVTSADAEGIDLDITAAENVMVMLGYVEVD